MRHAVTGPMLFVLLIGLRATPVMAEEAIAEESKLSLEVFGFAMTDTGYDFRTNDPNWYDVVRPTKLPSFPGEFGDDGRVYFGVRQTRLGIKALAPTDLGDLKVHLEAELFGTGVDAGQTTFRLRHAFGELGKFGAGQTWSTFMDPDVFPNSVEYWGPSGMVFYRNIQLRWRPINNDAHRFQVSLENPGGSADVGSAAERIELEDVTPRFPAPDVSAHYRYTGKFGHVQLAGLLRYIRWDDLGTDAIDLTGDVLGWGVNLSSNVKIMKLVTLKLSVVYGSAIHNYMNDASFDVGLRPTGDPSRPVEGVGLPTVGVVAFADFDWNKYLTSSAGYSFVALRNSSGQEDRAFQQGHYALANLLVHPLKDLMFGPELQFGQRQNFRDTYVANDFRIQFSARYSFSHTFVKD